ncbi:MAG: DEAD/DEAH box helicase [Parabacteroides sp.]|nr:DEAD/DEAH box helicase [Parabacteroides sp.]
MQEIEVDYMNYNGELFNTLRTLHTLRTQKQFTINWEGSEDNIYLHEHDYLIYLLMRCPNLIDSRGEKITTGTETALLTLKITEEKEMCHARFYLNCQHRQTTRFRFLTNSFVLVDNRIYPIESVGEEYRQTSVFATTFPASRIDAYLSILYSRLRGIRLDYKDYRVNPVPEPVSTRPVLIFEKIDSDKSLFIRLSKMLPNIEHTVIEEYELTVDAQINDIDRTVTLRTIIQEPTGIHIERLSKLLARHAPTKELRKEIYQDTQLFIVPEKIAKNFILNELSGLLGQYTVYGTEKLAEYHIRPVIPRIDLSIASNLDYLGNDIFLCFGQEKMELFNALKQFRQQNYILLADGTRAIVNEEYMQQIEEVFRREGKNVKLSAFDFPLIEEHLEPGNQSAFIRQQRDIYEGFNRIGERTVTLPPLKARLRDYQLKGVKWLDYLYEHRLGGCLADDMGLGKTLQTIVMLAKAYMEPRQQSLILMPKSLLYNWFSEIKKFAPQLTPVIYTGTKSGWPEAQIILTTYGTVRSNPEAFTGRSFHYIILDESQNIKNRNTRIAKAVMQLRGEHRLALSGTPIENNLTELYTLFRFLNPGMFGEYEEFTRLYAYPIQHNNDKKAIVSLKKKIYPFVMRRLKKDVLAELPDRIEQTLYVEMSEEQQALYESRRAYYYEHVKNRIATDGIQNAQFILFQALNELRRIASVPEILTDGQVASPKTDLLADYLVDAVANNHKVIVFFNYIAGIDLISDRLNEENIDFVTMTGSTKERQSVIDRFQKDKNCKVFLLTLKTGGVGLNLTAADTMFLFEPWWNKAAEEQAVSRIHRIGQTKKVISYSFITRGTIEEKIQLLQQHKMALFATLIENDRSSLKNLSETDIDYILG